MNPDYDVFDYKITESEWARDGNTLDVSITNNGHQWMSFQISQRHAAILAQAILDRVSLGQGYETYSTF